MTATRVSVDRVADSLAVDERWVTERAAELGAAGDPGRYTFDLPTAVAAGAALLLLDDAQRRDRMLTPTQLAEHLQVSPRWVYENKTALGAVTIGDGPKSRLRFDRAAIERWKAAHQSHGAPPPPVRRPGRRKSTTARVDLLPIRGQ